MNRQLSYLALALKRLTARQRRVETEKPGLKQATVTAVSPLEVSFDGSSKSVFALALDGCELSVSDRVSVLVRDTDFVVLGRNTDDPHNSDGGSGVYQPLDSDLTAISLLSTTSFGRSLLTQANAAAALSTIGAASSSHTHAQSDVTGLVAALALLAPLASPALTGNPTAPTQTAGNNSTRLATTAYVDTADALKAPLASPTFTGDPKAPTPSTSDNDTSVATTAHVKAQPLSAFAVPTANVPMNTKKLTGLTPGTTSGDSAEYAQMIAGDVAAQLGFTLKASVAAASIAALPAHSRSGDVLTASANGFLAPSFGTLKFSWASGSSGTGNGQFDGPYDVALDSSGNIYVADKANARIQKFNSSGVYQSQFAAYGGYEPLGLAIDGSGNIWTISAYRVEKFNSSGVWQAGSALSGPVLGRGGIACDSSGNVFVSVSSSVQKFNSSAVYQSSFGSYGTGNGEFDTPRAIAIDSSNNIYVADTGNNRVQKFNSSGVYQSQFGSTGSGDGEFYGPSGIDVDSSGNIWVAGLYNGSVQKFDSTGTFQARVGSAGVGNGQLYAPRGVVVHSGGDLIVADSLNNRIQRFTALTLTAGQSVLVRHEGSGTSTENNIYTVTNAGSASTQWQLTLRSDMATGYAKNQNLVIAEQENGAQNRVFVLNTADPITVWTTSLTWSRFEPGGPPSPHAANHAPGGTDPILTGIPVAVGTANSEGTADSFARSDHVHKLDAPGCRVYRSTNQSISNATGTAISFNQERYDPDNMHDNSTNPSRVTISKAGVYQVTGNIRTAANTTGARDLWLQVNSSTIIGFNALTASATDSGLSTMQVAATWKFAAGDYVELVLWQNSGGSLNVEPWSGYSPELSVQYVGAG